MTTSKLQIIPYLISLVLAFPTFVQGEEVEEISYEDLVQRLSRKKDSYSSVSSPLDDIMVHAGFGIVSSSSNGRYDGRSLNRTQHGFQISLGIDLFSSNWLAEGVFRNFGSDNGPSQARSMRETDINIIYRDSPSKSGFGYRLGMGLSTRSLKFYDEAKGEDILASTPAALVHLGLDSYINRHLSLGVGLSARSAIVDDAIDRFSVEAGIRLDTYF